MSTQSFHGVIEYDELLELVRHKYPEFSISRITAVVSTPEDIGRQIVYVWVETEGTPTG